MESRLARISRLRSHSGIVGVQIKHPNRYYRQYLGIVINNRKFIFINAFCDETPPEFWREKVSINSDQYSFAASYVELRLGRRLFPDQGFMGLMKAHLERTL